MCVQPTQGASRRRTSLCHRGVVSRGLAAGSLPPALACVAARVPVAVARGQRYRHAAPNTILDSTPQVRVDGLCAEHFADQCDEGPQ
jgi:hypothetical protein